MSLFLRYFILWPGRNSINDFRPEPRDVFHLTDQVVTEVPKVGPDAYKDSQGRTPKSDGVDPLGYGYPSGVIGLRLFPNPDFFIGPDAKRAQAHWNAEAFYNDHAFATDPRRTSPPR